MAHKRDIKIGTLAVLLGAVLLLAWRSTPAAEDGPARLDASTPAAQGGFRLVAVAQGDGAGTYDYREGGAIRHLLAVLHLAPPPEELSLQTPDDPDGGIMAGGVGLWVAPPTVLPLGSAQYTATARASTGQQMSLNPGPLIVPPLLFVIPAGYPDRVKYFDVTVADDHGHTARWRITHLPPMRHLLTPDTPPNPVVTADGLRLSFHAWRDARDRHDDLSPDPGRHQIDLGTFVSAAPGAANQTGLGGRPLQEDIGFASMTPEWVQPGYTPASTRTQTYLLDRGKGAGPVWDTFPQDYSPFLSPYAAQESLVRFGATLRTFDTCDERVTFHRVHIVRGHLQGGMGCYLVSAAGPRSLTTPSGITVTLPAQDLSRVLAGRPPSSGDAALYFQMSLHGAGPAALPKSPLWRRYRKPVTAEIIVPASWGGDGPWVGPGNVPMYTEDLSQNSAHAGDPAGTHDLTVTVRQRADVDTTPLTLTLPLEARMPTRP